MATVPSLSRFGKATEQMLLEDREQSKDRMKEKKNMGKQSCY
jgi:hypothetical protein